MSKRLILIVSFLFMNCCFGNAQFIFQKTYGGNGFDVGNYAIQTNDSGYIVIGSTSSYGAGQDDTYLIKTNHLGDTIWTKTFGGSNAENGRSVQQTFDNGYILCVSGSVSKLIKTNSIGDTVWTRSYLGSFYAEQTSDSGYIVACTPGFGMNLIKTSSTGDTLWTRYYNGTNFEGSRMVHETNDGGYIMVGYTQAFGAGGYDIYVIKTNNIGNLEWSKTYGGIYEDIGESICLTNDGGYVIVGTTYSFSFSGFSPDVYTIKIDSIGNVLWSKIYGGNMCYDHGQNVCLTNDGGFAIVGYTQCFGDDILLVKTNSIGNIVWTKTYGGIDQEAGYSVKQTFDGGFIISALTSSFGAGATSPDLYLLKLDSLGNGICNQTIPPTSTTIVNTTVTNPLTVTSYSAWFPTSIITISNGADVHSLCLATSSEKETYLNPRINIFPNPLTNKARIEFQNFNNENLTLLLYDIEGRVVRNISNIQTEYIELEKYNLNKGIYIVELRNRQQVLAKGKLSVN